MRIFRRGLIVSAVVWVSLGLAAAPANAATGRLTLQGSGADVVLINPSQGCYTNTTEFSQVTNGTDVPVVAFQGTGCSGGSVVVSPGSSMPVGARLSVSVPS